MDFAQYFTQWCEKDEGDVTPEWRRTRASLVRKHCLPVLANVDLDQIGAPHLREIRERTTNLSPETRNKITHSALRRVLRDVEADGYTEPGLVVRLYQGVRQLRGDPDQEPTPLTVEQRDSVLSMIHRLHGHDVWAFFLWQFLVGTRPNEALGLRYDSIDTEDGRAVILEGCVNRRHTKLKTARSRRIVDVPPTVMKTIHPTGDGQDYVYPVNYRWARERVWAPIVEALRIRVNGKTPKPYATRSTYVSICLSRGASISAVAAQTGTKPTVLETRYWKHTCDKSRIGRFAE